MPVEIDPKLARLRAEIQNNLDYRCEDPAFREGVLRTLARPGFVLHPEAPCRAGLLSLEVHEAITGSLSTAAFHAAVAAEYHMEAAYLFDHVADTTEPRDDGLTAAEELAIAIALLSCGQTAVYDAALASGFSGRRLKSLMHWASDCAVKCCTGQFLDAYLEKMPSATMEESLQMTSLKAGSLGRFAAGLGASVATDDPDVVNSFADFGFNLFTYFQLLDDLRDASPVNTAETDLTRHKKTLPVVYFRNPQAERNPQVVRSIIPQETHGGAPVDAGQQFGSSGACFFGAIVAEAFLNRVKGELADLKSRLGTVGNLERLVSSFEISPQEVVADL